MPIGQSLLAEMLGVQRPSITHAIADLQGAGLIERGRQQVTILDRQGLRRDLHGDALRKSECDGDAQACPTAKGFLMSDGRLGKRCFACVPEQSVWVQLRARRRIDS
jgi:hypothetical protein